MLTQLKAIQSDVSNGKSSSLVLTATDELQYLMDFNANISQAMVKTMEHLSDFVFVSMANLTVARQDSYLSHLKTGIKPDTLAALRTAPLQMVTLFPDDLTKQNRILQTLKVRDILTPARRVENTLTKVLRNVLIVRNRTDQPEKPLGIVSRASRARARPLNIYHDRPRISSPINDNLCINAPVYAGLLAWSKKIVNVCQ